MFFFVLILHKLPFWNGQLTLLRTKCYKNHVMLWAIFHLCSKVEPNRKLRLKFSYKVVGIRLLYTGLPEHYLVAINFCVIFFFDLSQILESFGHKPQRSGAFFMTIFLYLKLQQSLEIKPYRLRSMATRGKILSRVKKSKRNRMRSIATRVKILLAVIEKKKVSQQDYCICVILIWVSEITIFL